MDSDFLNNEPTAEQLWQLLSDQVGVAKVSTLIDLAVHTYKKNHDGYAFEIIDFGVEIARKEADETTLARALSVRGDVLSFLGAREESARDYLEAAELFQRNDMAESSARDFHDAADQLMQMEKYDEALECINSGLFVAMVENNEPEATGRCYFKWSQIASRKGDSPQDILALLDQARMYLRVSGPTSLVLEIDERRATVLAHIEKFQEGIEIIQNSLHVIENLDEAKSGYLNFLLGKLHRAAERWEEALPYLDKSEKVNQKKKDVGALACIYLEKARCMQGIERFDEAVALAERAQSHFDISGNDDGLAECKEELARFRAKAGQPTC